MSVTLAEIREAVRAFQRVVRSQTSLLGPQRLSEGDREPDFYIGTQQQGAGEGFEANGVPTRMAESLLRSKTGKSAAARGGAALADALAAAADLVEGLSGAGGGGLGQSADFRGGTTSTGSLAVGRIPDQGLGKPGSATRSNGASSGRTSSLAFHVNPAGQAADAAAVEIGAQNRRDGRQRRSNVSRVHPDGMAPLAERVRRQPYPASSHVPKLC